MRFLPATLSLGLAACAHATVIPLSNDTIQITSAAAPVCGMTGAQKVALRGAAVETIKRGYDRFLITGGAYANNVAVVGHTPVVARTSGSGYGTVYGNNVSMTTGSTTTVTGGQPIIAGSHNQGLVVKMYKDGQPGADNAISARAELGPKWQEIVAAPGATCL
ncbi:MAG: hypothetical protein KJ622_05390 [Alphaproteobacteria bacterium]|nr:hypothetical protein [Alphaproteobacteria bacterium]